MREKTLVRGILLGDQHASDIVIERGKVTRIARAGRRPADFGSPAAIIAPALFDIQVNGACGINLQGSEVQPEDIVRISDCLASQGVSHWVPTLITGPAAAMEHGCHVVAKALRDRRVARAVPGVHLEGPYISPEDGPRGAHPKAHVRPPDLREFARLMRAADGKIRYVTLAPEAPGAVAFIRALVKRGVTVSLGHHAATAAQIAAAVDAGARLCTHLGNGAAPQIHRHLNPLWPQLADDRLTASLIADLHHLPADAMKTFVRAKGPERIILVSDCTRIAGLPPGKYREFGAEVELKPNGKLCLSGTDLLAGSASFLLEGVINAWRATDHTLEQAFACATSAPAKTLGVRLPPSGAKLGRPADFVVFEIDRGNPVAKPKILAVFIEGRRVTPAA